MTKAVLTLKIPNSWVSCILTLQGKREWRALLWRISDHLSVHLSHQILSAFPIWGWWTADLIDALLTFGFSLSSSASEIWQQNVTSLQPRSCQELRDGTNLNESKFWCHCSLSFICPLRIVGNIMLVSMMQPVWMMNSDLYRVATVIKGNNN